MVYIKYLVPDRIPPTVEQEFFAHKLISLGDFVISPIINFADAGMGHTSSFIF